jgi:hypothetical protein
MRLRRWRVAAFGLGVTLLIGSVVFRVAAAPALVRFPLNVDETAYYTGTALTYVDQATLLPLAKPKSEPLQLSRQVKVVSGTFAKAVIGETVTVKTGGATTVETYQYVINRRTMQMMSDPGQYAFGESTAVMHATGAYRVNFAMGTSVKGTYLAYIPEADVTNRLILVEGLHTHPDVSLPVIDLSSKLEEPVAPYYLKHLQAMGLPMQITGAQLEPQLVAAGVNVNRALVDVMPHLMPAEKELIAQVLAKPVKLNYFFIDNGIVSIEPKTGALIDVHTQSQGIAVRPDLSGVGVLDPLLRRYGSIPSVKALSVGLAHLAARAPQLAERYTYTETVPSSQRAATLARKNARMMTLVEVRIPWAMAVLGIFLLALGLVLLRRGRRRNSGADPGVVALEAMRPETVYPESIAPEPVARTAGSALPNEGA